MPAVSQAQRIVAAIAEHHPEKLYARNKGMAQMSKEDLHDFASTKTKGLPKRKKKLQMVRAHVTKKPLTPPTGDFEEEL